MADHADDNFDGNVFIYRGGRAPQHVTHVFIDESVYDIEAHAFRDCQSLVSVETHEGIRRIGGAAFYRCISMRRIDLKSVVEIDAYAFYGCELESVEFGDRLETIGNSAFYDCRPLTHLKLPSIVTIGGHAFSSCFRLTDIEFSRRLETIGSRAFSNCVCLQRIAVPLKRDLFEFDDLHVFKCDRLTTVDLVGGVHKTVASLHMESWRTEMIAEINQINQVLPNTLYNEKTEEIQRWMETVLDKMDHYKAEHFRYVKEGITLLELALWNARLDEKEDNYEAEGRAKKAKVDTESARKVKRMTCGADMVINNVLPFLQLE